MIRVLADNGFLYFTVTVLVGMVLVWLLIHLILKLLAGIAADDAARSFHDQWCKRRGEPTVRQKLQQLRGTRLAGDPEKVAEFQRLCHERRIGVRV